MSGSETQAAGGIAAPVLDLHYTLVTAGHFPEHNARALGPQDCAAATIGMIHAFAGRAIYVHDGCPDGRETVMHLSPDLWTLFGEKFSRSDFPNFNRPDLRRRIALGGGPDGVLDGATLSLTWLIAARPVAEWDFAQPGTLTLFAGDYAPPGWLIADGRLIDRAAEPQLFEAIGTRFGGDSASFALPDLRGKAVIGAGARDGEPPLAIGQPVDAAGPPHLSALACRYLICVQGGYPRFEGGYKFGEGMAFMGHVVATASDEVPRGWMPAEGQMLSKQSFVALHDVLDDRFGGDDGHFALPDLRGRIVRASDGTVPPIKRASAAEILAKARPRTPRT